MKIVNRFTKIALLAVSFTVLSTFSIGKSWAFIAEKSPQHNNYIQEKKTRGRKIKKLQKEVREEEWKKFTKKYGSDWQVTWNKATGTPHRITQKGLPSDKGLWEKNKGLWKNIFWGQEQLENYTYNFIEENKNLFRLDGSEIKLTRITKRNKIWYLDFQQIYQNIPVGGSRIRFEFNENYELLNFGSDTYPEIDINCSPLIDNNEAQQIVDQHLQSSETWPNQNDVQLIILPINYEGEIEYYLAWVVNRKNYRYFVDAQSAEIIKRHNLARTALTGKVEGMILPKFFNDDPVKVPFKDLKVYILNKSEPIETALMDNNQPAGWQTDGLWQFGDPEQKNINELMNIPGHAGPPNPEEGHTGNNIFGYNLGGDYSNLMRPKYLTTSPISCLDKEGVILRFWRWLGVYKEYCEDAYGIHENYDRASVEVSNDDGSTWSTIWSNGTGQVEDALFKDGLWTGWNLQVYDLSRYADNETVKIRWSMGPTDSSGVFCGWNIDDIEVLESQQAFTDSTGNFSFYEDTNSITWEKNTFSMKIAGKYVEVYNEDTRDALYVVENVDPNDTVQHCWCPVTYNDIPSGGYDELTVYYHINRMIQYIKTIDSEFDGMNPDRKGPIKVITRWGENYNNAFWSPLHLICFGEGDSKQNGFRNFALFSDIIYHEYTHGITESFYSFFMPLQSSSLNTTDGEDEGPVFTTELDAMHEAFSDYWAATLTDDDDPDNPDSGHLIGDGDVWIGHDYVRNLENPFEYPDDYGDDPYANSLILSGGMWDVRQQLGKNVADTLLHFARYSGDTTFADYLASILQQDKIIYKGAHLETLKEIFGFRGISKSPNPPTRLIADAGDTTVELTWEAVDDPDVIGYYAYYRTENDIETSREDPSVRRDIGNETIYTLDGLSNETTYVLKVTSYNTYGTESEYSDYVYATPYDSSSSKYSAGGGTEGTEGSYVDGFCFIQFLKQ